MIKTALLLACLASVGDGQQFEASGLPIDGQTSSNVVFKSSRKQGSERCIRSQVRAIAMLLLALTPQVSQALSPVLRPCAVGMRPAATGGEYVHAPIGGWFDGANLGACVVRQRGPSDWVMWYSGRSTGYAKDVVPIATGHVGIAVSNDGLFWREVAGPTYFGSVLEPTRAKDDFASSHVAVGDVVIGDDGKYTMYMFGGDDKRPRMGSTFLPRGTVMRIGVAHSADGIVWERLPDPILEPSDDQMFVGWPQLVTVPSSEEGQMRRMLYYHAMRAGKFEICMAESKELEDDQSWEPHGCILQATPGTFYAGSVSARCVVPDPEKQGSLLMFFEAQDESRTHSIGLARSDDGLKWTVEGEEPVFQKAAAANSWDSNAVSRPWLVPMADGSARLYYVGRAADGTQAIGVAQSNGKDWTTWQRL